LEEQRVKDKKDVTATLNAFVYIETVPLHLRV
jgi:hypothetical protein